MVVAGEPGKASTVNGYGRPVNGYWLPERNLPARGEGMPVPVGERRQR